MPASRILIVEDEVIVAMELKSRLASFGYEVVGAVGYGEEAIEKAVETAPDLLLMDITLAGALDGIEAARRIHEIRDIPVVYLTAHSDEQTLQKAKQGDPFAYLIKPFTESELRTTIEVALHKHTKERQARDTAEWFSEAANSLRGAVMATDETGAIRHMNPLAETFAECLESEAVGKLPHEVLTLKHSSNGSILRDLFSVNREGGHASRSIDCILVSRRGEEIPVELTVLASRDGRQQGRAFVFAFRETGQKTTPLQDWFSWATNLRLAGAMCKREQRFPEAESFFRRALDILESHLGADHLKIADLLEDLAEICSALEKGRDAHILRLRAERIRMGTHSDVRFAPKPNDRYPHTTMFNQPANAALDA